MTALGLHACHADACVPEQMRGMSSALSAASSACDHIRDWVKGTPSGTWVSMGVFSDGSYGAPKVLHLALHSSCNFLQLPAKFKPSIALSEWGVC